MKTMTIIGLMSGSSLDGIDLAAVTFETDDSGHIHEWIFHSGQTISYDKKTMARLATAVTLSGLELWQLHVDLGHLFGKELNHFIATNNLEVACIASHGHTVFHAPDNHMTCQIGDGAAISSHVGVPVITDFRTTDLAHGGQGAPLAPLVDRLLFNEYSNFLNLGGIANLSTTRKQGDLAYDISACNQLFNFYANKLNLAYDEDGNVARKGKVQEEVLSYLSTWEYYEKPAPKSLDNSEVKVFVRALDERFNCSIEDMLHTSVHHLARKIASSFNNIKPETDGKIFTTGGGAFNAFFIETIESYLHQPYTIHVPEPDMINYKEAMLMCVAGLRRWYNLPIFYKTLTGASKDVTGGAIYWP